MKTRSVAKLDERNTATSKKKKKNDSDVMSKNCDAVVFFSIYSQFAAIRKLDFGCIVYKINILNNNLKIQPKNL